MPSLGLLPIGADLAEETSDDAVQIAVLNTIVNKNVIVVQYTTNALQKNMGFLASDSVINSKIRLSTDFGASWREITLQTNNDTWLKYGIDPVGLESTGHEMFGSDGALVSFIVRHSSGGRILMYTPIIKVFKTADDEFFPVRRTQIMGWLVHDEKGNKLNDGTPFPVPEIRPGSPDNHQQVMNSNLWNSVNLTTGVISPSGANADIAQPYTTYHMDPMLGGELNEANTGQGLANRVNTVDYTHGGKRYTIVQLYKNVVVKKGNVYSYEQTPGQPFIGFDYYAFTLPFLFVFDHDGFRNADKSLTWLDVFNLEGRLISMTNSVRGNKRAKAYIKSLLTDDANFNNTTGNDKVHFKCISRILPVDTTIHFTPTPRGELMKVHDAEDGKDLLGFVYGNHRFVCTDDPTERVNWIIGEVPQNQQYPRSTYAFAFDRFNDKGLLMMREDIEVKYAEAHELYYREYSVPMSKHATLRFDVAADRVFAVADPARNGLNDLRYKFMAFAKDEDSGRYTIDFLPESIDVGVQALTQSNYQGESNYPVEVSFAHGILYSTKDFIVKRPILAYVDPLDPGVEEPVEASQVIEEKEIDLDDWTLVSSYCRYIDRIGIYEHNTTGEQREWIEVLYDTSCGFDGAGPQPSKGTTMLLYPDLELVVNHSVPGYRCVQVEIVFSGNGELILRPRADSFDSRFIESNPGSIAIKLDNPQRYGLTSQQASFNMSLTTETRVLVGPYSGNEYYASSKLNRYDQLNITNPFGGPTKFTAAGAGENLTITFEGNGAIGTKVLLTKNNSLPSKTYAVTNRSCTITRTDLADALFLEFTN